MFGTEEFLKHFPDHCIQTFDDREYVDQKDPTLITMGPPRLYPPSRLQELNGRGAGIFFSVNQFPTGKRSKDTCAGINAWFTESDSLSIADQEKMFGVSPLTPTFLVRSKKSYHAYWLAKDPTEKNFVRIQQGLIQHFKGDPAMKDISRVLRVPGYYHNKTYDSFLVEIAHAAPELVYTEKQMLDAFPFTAVAPQLPTVRPATPATANDFWGALGQLSNKEVLNRLSGTSIVNGETYSYQKRSTGGEHIYVNGKPADAWIDDQGMIGSGKKGGPTWMQWLSFYGRSKAEIAEWAKQNLRDLIPASVIEQPQPISSYNAPRAPRQYETLKKDFKISVTTASEHIRSVTESFLKPPSPFTWGTKELDRKLPAIEEGHYVLIFGQQASGKTTVAFNMAKENAKKISNTFFLTLEMSKDQLLRRYARDRAGVTKEMYRNRNFDTTIAEKYLPDLGDLKLVGIDSGETYDVAKIEEMIQQFGVKMLYIDNLNKVQGPGRGELEVTQNVSQGILNLTRKYNIPIVLIHHANKQVNEKKKKGEDPNQNKFRGMSGMRGTNKTADDADIIIEVMRPGGFIEGPVMVVDDYESRAKTSVAVYKDREFDSRTKADVFYYGGNFVDDFEIIRSTFIAQNQEKQDLENLASEFGGEVVG